MPTGKRDYLCFNVFSSETVSFFLPFLLRDASTLRPFADAILSRKPCLFFLFLLEGWYVRFIFLTVYWMVQPSIMRYFALKLRAAKMGRIWLICKPTTKLSLTFLTDIFQIPLKLPVLCVLKTTTRREHIAYQAIRSAITVLTCSGVNLGPGCETTLEEAREASLPASA